MSSSLQARDVFQHSSACQLVRTVLLPLSFAAWQPCISLTVAGCDAGFSTFDGDFK